MPVVLKVFITAILVVAISEMSKRSTWIGAILASLPITSVLAMIWLYRDTGDLQKVADLSRGVFWAVLPSLAFFLIFPFLVNRGMRFGASLALSAGLTALGYVAFAAVVRKAI